MILYIKNFFLTEGNWGGVSFYRQKAWWRMYLKDKLRLLLLRNANMREMDAHYWGEKG